MQITRSATGGTTATNKGPAEWFTGDVYIDPVAATTAPSRVQANLVHFMPGARTAWHRHPLGQSLFVTEGIGLGQRRGGPIEVIRPGDRVYIEPDEEHWHGATPDRLMVHLATQRGRRPARRRSLGRPRQRRRIQRDRHRHDTGVGDHPAFLDRGGAIRRPSGHRSCAQRLVCASRASG